MCTSVIGRHLITRTPPPNLPPRMSVEAIFRLNNDRGYCVITQEPRSWFQQMSNTCMSDSPFVSKNNVKQAPKALPKPNKQYISETQIQKHCSKKHRNNQKNVQKIMLKNFQTNTPKSYKIMTKKY